MGDYYLEHPNELKGQKKRTIAEYVKQNGILTRNAFDSFQDAKDSGLEISVVPEHAKEYFGARALLTSLGIRVLNHSASEDKLKDIILNQIDEGKLKISTFDFMNQKSYSYWQKINGFNRTVVADSAIPDRYHVSTSLNDVSKFLNYAVVDNGKIFQSFLNKLTPDLVDGMFDLIYTYEKIRNLDRFDENNCPKIQFITSNNKDYFIDYDRGRDFSRAQFILDRKSKTGEIKAYFVRGATPPQGIMSKVYLPSDYTIALPVPDRIFDIQWDYIINELITEKSELQLIINNDLESEIKDIVLDNKSQSQFYKPMVSVITPVAFFKNKDEMMTYQKQLKEQNKDPFIKIHIISDGKKAYLKRID